MCLNRITPHIVSHQNIFSDMCLNSLLYLRRNVSHAYNCFIRISPQKCVSAASLIINVSHQNIMIEVSLINEAIYVNLTVSADRIYTEHSNQESFMLD